MPAPRSFVIVEDEYLLQVLVEDMLTDMGHRVLQSSATLDEAVAVCQTEDFDLALLDPTLGGVPSLPVADVLNRRRIPYAFMTGHDAAEIPAAYARAPLLCKPFRSDDLAAVIARLIPDPIDARTMTASPRPAARKRKARGTPPAILTIIDGIQRIARGNQRAR